MGSDEQDGEAWRNQTIPSAKKAMVSPRQTHRALTDIEGVEYSGFSKCTSPLWLFTAAVKTLARVCTHQERSANPTSKITDGKGEGELNTTMESGKFHTEGVSTYPKRK